jgi:hypothetical protein
MAIYPFYKNVLLKANYEHVETEHTIAPAGIVDGNTDCKNRSNPDTNVGVRPDTKTEFNRTVKRS